MLWSPIIARYVSLGDSIAADSAGGSQYGVDGNTETKISTSSYTNLIHKELMASLGGNVSAISYARSGDKVEDLMEKLTHERVQKALSKADYVTVCIGANDVLGAATDRLEEYITSGDAALEALKADVYANIARLADDSDPNSYTALINKLKSINPNAKYVFTTVYNPYKYLWIEEGPDGFLAPVLDAIPDISLYGLDVDGIVRSQLLNADVIELFFERVNGLDEIVEDFVMELNRVLRSKISGHPNFALADSKALFDVFPDRPVAAEKNYNDLINMKYTRGFDAGDIHWGRLWQDSSATEFWMDLIVDHVSLNGVDVASIASEFLSLAISEVIYPDIDPHPEDYGQYVLKRSFADTFGIEALDRHTITYDANGGTGLMEPQMVVGVDGLMAFTHISANAFNGADGKSAYEFAKDGGYNAKSPNADSIQLGEGTYTEEKSLQIYDKKPMNGRGMIPFARYARYVSGKTVTLNEGDLYASLSVSEISGKGSAIIVPVLVDDTFGMIATVKCNSDKYYIHVTRSPELAAGTYSNIGVDYWIFSETAL